MLASYFLCFCKLKVKFFLIVSDVFVSLNNRGSGKKTWWVHRLVESCANCANAWKV